MASWQGEHRQRVQPSPGCQIMWAAVELQAGRAWPWYWDVAQLPSTCQKVQTDPSSRTHLCPWVLPGDRTAPILL